MIDESEMKPLWDGFVADRARPLSVEESEFFRGKTVLITGAGGYLGSALALALARLHVRRLVLLDVVEYGLYRVEQELRRAGEKAVLTIGSVCNDVLARSLFGLYAPEVVFHTAAMKHVPLMESNALAAAEVNVLGTEVMVEASSARPVRFVHLSTDKAVAPLSVMGATKRMAEQIVLRAHRRQIAGSSYTAVRLSNVLGSTGSVAPLFARQIAEGGVLTVTHPEATRFFVTKIDAVQHLLRAAVSEFRTGLVIPQVGEARGVQDLAMYVMKKAKREAASAEHAYTIKYTGLRVADKLHERMLASFESVCEGKDEVRSVESPFDPGRLDRTLAQVKLAVKGLDAERLLRAIEEAVPEYAGSQARHTEAIGASA